MNRANKIYLGFLEKLKPIHALLIKLHAERAAKHAFSYLKTPPVLIYQMGKVGSSTVYKSLIDATLPNPILHLHFLSHDLPKHREMHINAGIYPPPYHIYLGEATRDILKKNQNRSVKIISLLRDPIAFAVSDIFQNPHFASETVLNDTGAIDAQKASDYLNRALRKPATFSYLNEWFDKELKQVFDIDVFAKPFPVEAGYDTYTKNKIEVLVMRLEDLSQKGSKAIYNFLNLDKPLVLKQNNVRNETKEAKTYQKILNKVSLTPSLCSEIYQSRFVRHFYSTKMVKKFISKWT